MVGAVPLSVRVTVYGALVAFLGTGAIAIAVSAHGSFKWAAVPLIAVVTYVFLGLLFGWPYLSGIPRRGRPRVSLPLGVQCRMDGNARVVFADLRNHGPHAEFSARGEWVLADGSTVGTISPWPVCLANQAGTVCSVETDGRQGFELARIHLGGISAWKVSPLQPAFPLGDVYTASTVDLDAFGDNLVLRVNVRSSLARKLYTFDVGFNKDGRGAWQPYAIAFP